MQDRITHIGLYGDRREARRDGTGQRRHKRLRDLPTKSREIKHGKAEVIAAERKKGKSVLSREDGIFNERKNEYN